MRISEAPDVGLATDRFFGVRWQRERPMCYQASKATPLWSVGSRWFMAVFHSGKLVHRPKRCRLRGLIRHRPLPLPPHSKRAVGCQPASGASEIRVKCLSLPPHSEKIASRRCPRLNPNAFLPAGRRGFPPPTPSRRSAARLLRTRPQMDALRSRSRPAPDSHRRHSPPKYTTSCPQER